MKDKPKVDIRFQPLLDQLSNYIELHIKNRGLEYYYNGQVEDVEISAEWIKASVLGRYGDYDVRIHRQHFSLSDCDCPYHDYCKHMAAVVYEVVMGEYEETPSEEMLNTDSDTKHSLSKNNKDILVVLQSLDREELLAILSNLIEIDPRNWQFVQQLLLEREQTSQLQKMKSGDVSWAEAVAYYKQEVPAILKACQELFKEVEVDSYSYRYYDEEESSWDFTFGIERLERWKDELSKLMEQSNWNLGVAGYLVTLDKMRDWVQEFQEEMDLVYEDTELDLAYERWESKLVEQLEAMKSEVENEKDQEQQLSQLLQLVFEYSFKKSKSAQDIVTWFPVWSECVTEPTQLAVVQQAIEKINPMPSTSQPIQKDSDEARVLECWIVLCLRLGQEQKAIKAAGKIEGFKLSLTTHFARYYEENQLWQQAKTNVEKIIASVHPHQSKYYIEWIIRLSQLSKDIELEQHWKTKLLIQFPSLELFKECVASITEQSEREIKAKEWLTAIRSKKQNSEIGIEILLDLGEIEEAWDEFVYHNYSPDWLPTSILKLFQHILERSPERLIPVYTEYIDDYIEMKKRPAYKKATRWLKELKKAYERSGQKAEWKEYYESLLMDYRRSPALMEEIRLACLE